MERGAPFRPAPPTRPVTAWGEGSNAADVQFRRNMRGNGRGGNATMRDVQRKFIRRNLDSENAIAQARQEIESIDALMESIETISITPQPPAQPRSRAPVPAPNPRPPTQPPPARPRPQPAPAPAALPLVVPPQAPPLPPPPVVREPPVPMREPPVEIREPPVVETREAPVTIPPAPRTLPPVRPNVRHDWATPVQRRMLELAAAAAERRREQPTAQQRRRRIQLAAARFAKGIRKRYGARK